MYHSYVSLKKFRGNVHFKDITVSFLYEYENWLTSQDISKTTIGMYLRPLHTIFNEAIEDGIIKKEKCYPFGRRKYNIPASKNTKKALDLKDILYNAFKWFELNIIFQANKIPYPNYII